jgi:hypothetical protein
VIQAVYGMFQAFWHLSESFFKPGGFISDVGHLRLFSAKRGCWYGIPRALFFHRTQNTDYIVFHLHIML